ncbi:MAG: hypothetical protein KatS3mg105_2718 [Gemmatales bacterium]|nr:MAG: hypothetical protein KatS3mg105_2718 [Gemmatales bacterium]
MLRIFSSVCSVLQKTVFSRYSFLSILVVLVFTLKSAGQESAESLPPLIPAAYYPGDRHEHPNRPNVQVPQDARPATADNVDTERPFLDWQHATDDWFGLRPLLDDSGVVFDASLTYEMSRSLQGGTQTQRGIARHLFDLNLTLDAERLVGWNGATFFADFQTFGGPNDIVIVEDFQGFSNIAAVGRTQLSQLWYEQRFWSDSVRLKLGKIDANSEFAFVDYASEFLNSSMGFSPTIFVMPSYPNPSTV